MGNAQRNARTLTGIIDPVARFGADPTGTIDSTAAIQAAIDYAATFAGYYGLTIEFPRGDYRYTALNINAGFVNLHGLGDVRLIKTTTTGDGLTIKGLVGRIYGNKISGITFANLTAASAGRQLFCENLGQLKLDKVSVTNYPAAAWQGIELYNVSQSTIDIDVQNCLDIGFKARDCVDVTPKPGSRCDVNGSHGWEFDTCAGVYPSSVTSYGNTGRGWNIVETIGSPVLATPGSAFHFYSSCIGDTNGSDNWNLTNLKNSELSACWGATQSGATADKHGFIVDGCTGVSLRGLVAVENNGAGLRIIGGSTGIDVIGGRFNNNGKVVGSTKRRGVSLAASSSLTMTNVQMTDNQSGKTQVYGIEAEATVSRLVMGQCDMAGNLTGPYSFASIPAVFIETDNTTGESSSIASAGTITLSPFGRQFTITGATTINAIATQYAGRCASFIFSGAPTVGDAGTLKLAGNFVAAANATLVLESDGTNWYETSRSLN